MTPGPMDTPADNATAPVGAKPPNPNPSAVPVTEEGRSWTIWRCDVCGDFPEVELGEECEFCCDGKQTEFEVVESSKLGAVEAELGRLREAVERYRDYDGSRGTYDALELGDARRALDAALASSPGREAGE